MLSETDRAILDRPLLGMLTVPPAPDRLPAPRPVWFELTDADELQMFSVVGTPRVQRLEHDLRATLVVAKPAGEPEGWVSVEADVTMHPDGAQDLADRLTDRYWGTTETDRRATAKATWRVENLRRIVLHPRRIAHGPS